MRMKTSLVAAAAVALLGSAPAYADCGVGHTVAEKERPVVQAPDTVADAVKKLNTERTPAQADTKTTPDSTQKGPLALAAPTTR